MKKSKKIFIGSLVLLIISLFAITSRNTYSLKIDSNKENIEKAKQNLTDYIISTYEKDGVNHLYYHNGRGDYEYAQYEANDKSYRYSGGDYSLTEKAENDGYTEILSTSSSTKGLILVMCNDNLSYVVGSSCTSQKDFYYTLAYDNEKHFDSIQDCFAALVEDDYIKKENINNFVCFGYDDGTREYRDGWCPEDNLYRIIGLFKREQINKYGVITGTNDYVVKLIKATYATTKELGGIDVSTDYYNPSSSYYDISSGVILGKTINVDKYYWSSTYMTSLGNGYDNWKYSALNMEHLNDYFINTYLTNFWRNKIDDAVWYISGYKPTFVSSTPTIIAYEAYNRELGDGQSITSTDYYPIPNKVGLMYISEYAYAVSPEYWNETIGSENKTDNWLYNGEAEHTLSITGSYDTDALYISNKGIPYKGTVYNAHLAVRPTFYLKPSAKYKGGTGSMDDPYRIR